MMTTHVPLHDICAELSDHIIARDEEPFNLLHPAPFYRYVIEGCGSNLSCCALREELLPHEHRKRENGMLRHCARRSPKKA